MSLPPCPKCQSEYVYEDQANLVCPECGHEWNPADNSDDDAFVVRDSNGKVLEYIGLTPERLRLPGKALCAGTMNDAGQIGAADCTIEGTIVPYVAKTIDLEGRIEAALTGPARGDAADPLAETSDPAQ